MMKQIILALTLSMAFGLATLDRVWAHDAAEHITHVMKAQFDTPENPLTVEPVTVGGDFAVAGWRQGDKGAVRCSAWWMASGPFTCAAAMA